MEEKCESLPFRKGCGRVERSEAKSKKASRRPLSDVVCVQPEPAPLPFILATMCRNRNSYFCGERIGWIYNNKQPPCSTVRNRYHGLPTIYFASWVKVSTTRPTLCNSIVFPCPRPSSRRFTIYRLLFVIFIRFCYVVHNIFHSDTLYYFSRSISKFVPSSKPPKCSTFLLLGKLRFVTCQYRWKSDSLLWNIFKREQT